MISKEMLEGSFCKKQSLLKSFGTIALYLAGLSMSATNIIAIKTVTKLKQYEFSKKTDAKKSVKVEKLILLNDDGVTSLIRAKKYPPIMGKEILALFSIRAIR